MTPTQAGFAPTWTKDLSDCVGSILDTLSELEVCLRIAAGDLEHGEAEVHPMAQAVILGCRRIPLLAASADWKGLVRQARWIDGLLGEIEQRVIEGLIVEWAIELNEEETEIIAQHAVPAPGTQRRVQHCLREVRHWLSDIWMLCGT